MNLNHLHDDIVASNTVPPDCYTQWDVKRGLRHADGSGVLAGLSRISSVVGTSKTADGQLAPVDGVLSYRGHRIDDLVTLTNGQHRFEYTAFLLLVGRPPTPSEQTMFRQTLIHHAVLPDSIVEHAIRAIPSPNIMNKLQTVVSALYTLDDDPETMDPYNNFLKSCRIMGAIPTIVAYAHLLNHHNAPTLVQPKPDMGIAEAFLYMLRQGNAPDPFEVDVLDLALLLHAEHGGGNNSSFTTYVVTSTQSDIYGTITAALGALKGPLHGAANKKVMDMMTNIKANVSDWTNSSAVVAYLEKIVEKKANDHSGKIYGLGHAVYTKSDPRAVILKDYARQLADRVNRTDEFNLYCLIEENGPTAFKTVKQQDKVIAPNVDFYSGFVYDCLGIPADVYTPMFAMARTAGWCAHRIEESLSGRRVIRPAYKFVG